MVLIMRVPNEVRKWFILNTNRHSFLLFATELFPIFHNSSVNSKCIGISKGYRRMKVKGRLCNCKRDSEAKKPLCRGKPEIGVKTHLIGPKTIFWNQVSNANGVVALMGLFFIPTSYNLIVSLFYILWCRKTIFPYAKSFENDALASTDKQSSEVSPNFSN